MYLSNIIKPTHICNLACNYCFNEDTRSPVMTLSTLDRVIQQSFSYCAQMTDAGENESDAINVKKSHIDFIWHGGEPMVAKIDFYRAVIKLQKQYSTQYNTVTYKNTMQTNGVLINEEWIEFFQENGFQVSISIDGPKKINDKTRNYATGKSSFDKVVAAIRKVKAAGLPLGIAVVISKTNKDYADEIFDFLTQEKLNFNVIPLNRSGDAVSNFVDLGLEADEYADPWIKMYDRWLDSAKEDYVYCSDFNFKTVAILSGKPSDCIGMKNCSKNTISVDPDGYVYPCATFSADPNWNYGNVNEQDLVYLMESDPAKRALNREPDEHCLKCKWQHVCHGGCFSRAYKFFGTENTRDYYCPSLYKIYEHIEKRLRQLVNQGNNVDLTRLPSQDNNYERESPKERKLYDKVFVRPGETIIKNIRKMTGESINL